MRDFDFMAVVGIVIAMVLVLVSALEVEAITSIMEIIVRAN